MENSVKLAYNIFIVPYLGVLEIYDNTKKNRTTTNSAGCNICRNDDKRAQMIGSAYAQTTKPVPACPTNYPTGPGPGGICIDGVACPKPLAGAATVVNGKCTDGPPTCPEGTKFNPATKKCEADPKCKDPNYPYFDKTTQKCQDGPPNVKFCPPPVGGPGPGDSHKDPFVDANGNCVIKPGAGGSDK